MGELLRRFSYPLTYIFLVSFCVIGVSSGQRPGDLGIASRLLLSLTLPLERLVTFPVREGRQLWEDYVALVGVREENDALRTRIAELEDQRLQYEEAIVSAERFQRLAEFRARNRVQMVPANVVAQDLSRYFRSVIIDQGAASGLAAGMPVLTDSGVVGVVVGTTLGAAKVLLVIDPQSRIDGYVQRSRARGTVRGRSHESCDFEYVLRDEDVQVGDLVLTSGLGAVYPKGLVIGEVERVERRPYGLFQRAVIRPAVDFRKLEEVFVILDRRAVPDEDEFLADSDGLWPEAGP
ncbi:MAG: rod shape-determining protein MreC [Myxococcota bacterium]